MGAGAVLPTLDPELCQLPEVSILLPAFDSISCEDRLAQPSRDDYVTSLGGNVQHLFIQGCWHEI